MTKLVALSVLLLLAPAVCLAVDSVTPVSKELAKKLGIEVRSKPDGPDHAWVELEAETKRLGEIVEGSGPVVDFSELPVRVGLEMRDGEKLLLSSTMLRDCRPRSGRLAVGFKVARSELNKFFLTVSADEGLGSFVYQIRVRDFVDYEGLRDLKPNGVKIGPAKGPSRAEK